MPSCSGLVSPPRDFGTACYIWGGVGTRAVSKLCRVFPKLRFQPPAVEVPVSRSLNKVILIGNIGQDPEVRSTSNGGRVANFSLATSRQWSGQGGDKQEKTEWHRVVAWNNARGAGTGLADVIEKYCKKGDKLYVEGRIEYRSWQDKEGQTRYTTEIIANEIIMLSGKGGSGDGGPSYSAPARAAASAPAKKEGKAESFEDVPAAFDGEEDDLPF